MDWFSTKDLPIPLAAIIAIVLCSYLALVLFIILIRYLLYVRGVFTEKSGNDQLPEACCGSCCKMLADCCSCRSISCYAILKSVCPKRPVNLKELVTCECLRGVAHGGDGVNLVCCEAGRNGR